VTQCHLRARHDLKGGSVELSTAASPGYLVVIGASAGGIEALSTLVATLPDDFSAPIVVAQHLSPTHPSQLPEILARRATLPVRIVADRMPLEPGVIYIISPNAQVEIADHHVSVAEERGARPAPLIDLLLTTAAHAYGENLIGVILSGTGSDGASGARDVKANGGTVIIQNPETAAHPEMALSLAPTTIDNVADLERIGPLLHDLVTGTLLPRPADDDEQLQTLLDRLRDHSGIDFTNYRAGTINRRLQRRIAATGTADLADYSQFAQRDPSEYQRLANSFLINVTEFFRDPDLFDYLRVEVLPPLVERARERGELRVWSAGCATGEEAYSLAMLLADALGADLERVTVRVFATDLDEDAIAFARRGIYPASALATVPAELIARQFLEIGVAYEVRKPIRNLVVFGQHDLGQRSPFPRIDLALCRNVLMYFTPELQKRALQLFAFALREGGLLALGKAETVNPLSEYFALQEPRLKIYRRVGDSPLISPVHIRALAPRVVATPVRAAPAAPRRARARPVHEIPVGPPAGIRGEHLLHGLPEGLLVVNERFQIQLINAAARRLLGIHGTAIGEDVMHLARYVPVMALREAIAAALRGDETTTLVTTDGLIADDVAELTLELRSFPERDEQAPEGVTLAATHIRDVTEREAERTALREAQTRLQRVTEGHRALVSANEELTAANLRLRAVNDELLVSNEEFQAATEEVETLNEEMQATNEELEALNEELQATVEELNTANEDLQARGVELQELAVTLDDQRRDSDTDRRRLQAVLLSMSDAVLVTDAGGRPILTNAAFSAMFGDTMEGLQPENEFGEPFPPERLPQRLAASGQTFVLPFTQPAPDGSRRWFEASGQPIRDDDGAEWGVVVVREITDRSLRHLQDEFLALASHELRSPLTALSGSLQMLRRRLPEDALDPRANRYIAQSIQQVNQLATLINDLGDVVRLQTGKLQATPQLLDLGHLATQMVEVARTLTERHAIEFEAPAEPLFVNADPRRIEQVMINLLNNAIAYAPDTERIDVELRRAGDMAELSVRDYGPGINPGDIERIFTRFYQSEDLETRTHGGLGLGLFIAREIVDAHGGTLEVASEPGAGATFTIRLPLVDIEPSMNAEREQ
jgi:two-component system CheB/CheR fusion protein